MFIFFSSNIVNIREVCLKVLYQNQVNNHIVVIQIDFIILNKVGHVIFENFILNAFNRLCMQIINVFL
jgi:hypothetical protein